MGRRAVALALLLASSGCSLNPPLRLAEGTGAVAPVELAGVPFHPQEAHHCGPASLLTLLEASGVATGYDAVVDRVYVPGLEGSLQVEMLAAARGFGRIAYPLPPRPEAVLAEVTAGRPVLLLLNLGLPSRPVWHYAVVVGFDPGRNRVVLRSGRTARSVQRAPSWLRRWDWAGRWGMVLLRPGDWPARPDRERLLDALAAFEDGAEPADATRAWRAAVERWPDAPIAWLGVGNAAFHAGDHAAAAVAYRRVLALEPKHLPARLNLALSLGEEGHPCAGLEALGASPEPEHPLHATFRELETRLAEDCGPSGPRRSPKLPVL